MQDSSESKISREQEQEILLKIVETWRLSETPEYRGFRCANCQEYKNEAWYHWVNTGGYRLPIHMCDDTCEPAFRNGNIQMDDRKHQSINRLTFANGYRYSGEAKKRFREIVASWPEYKKPKLKAFICDDCGQDLAMETLPDGSEQRQGYHVWWKMPDGGTLVEFHFHRVCGHKLGINN